MKKCPRCMMAFQGQPFVCPQCRYVPPIQDGFECFALEFDEASAGFSLESFRGVMLTVPQHSWLWSQLDVIAKHKRRYRKQELVRKMENAGFKVVMATSFMSFLTPFMLASRLRKMDAEKAHRQLALPKLLDKMLERVMAIERQLIQLGARFPVGGSLLVVGVVNRDVKKNDV